MKVKKDLKKKKESFVLQETNKMQKAEVGLGKIVGAHEKALEQNSKEVVEILERLTKTFLNESHKKDIKKIKAEIKDMDRKLDCIDALNNFKNSAIILEDNKQEEQSKELLEDEDIEMEDDWFEL